jgi:CO/xanthine dehydrogenase FAD-binding subunit
MAVSTAGYVRPERLADALEILAAGDRLILAGATDVYPAHVGRPLDEPVLDISAMRGLRAIASDADGWRIPALATWTDIAEAPLPRLFDGLRRAARTIGGPQVQNAGTLCGNLCNASPAADGIPNLLALDATVELASLGGIRRLAVGEFVTGYRRTARRPDELVTAVLVPRPDREARSTFGKLGSRAYLVISIVMVAGVLEIVEGRIAAARLAVGACSPVALRLTGLEAALTGHDLRPDLADLVEPGHLAALAPIDDVRATAAYRLDTAATLVRRAITELAR